jgi:hypothetical protein
MKVPFIFGAAFAAIAIAGAAPSVAHGIGETVTPHFEQSIPNIPGKSVVALVVNYEPGGASPSHIHAKSAFIFGYVLSGAIESQVNDGPRRVYRTPARAFTSRRAPVIPSAAMRAGPNPQACSPCSSSTAARRI